MYAAPMKTILALIILAAGTIRYSTGTPMVFRNSVPEEISIRNGPVTFAWVDNDGRCWAFLPDGGTEQDSSLFCRRLAEAYGHQFDGGYFLNASHPKTKPATPTKSPSPTRKAVPGVSP